MTPIENHPKLASAIGLSDLYFKREDMHPYGSHKGRSIPVMIDHYFANGDRGFAISSSGNAALAAALHIQNPKSNLVGSKLDIFVGNHVSIDKLKKIRDIADKSGGAIRVLVKERPLQALTQVAQEGVRSLRQSTDDEALVGYDSLAKEILTQVTQAKGSTSKSSGAKNIARGISESSASKIRAVFMGTSSGTTAQALAQYFLRNKSKIQMHIVQTSSCHPLADTFETYDGPNEKSIADAITDITGHRKSALVPLIEKTGGRAWVATNEDIATAQELVNINANLEISTNSALSVVGAMKAAYVGHKIDGTVVCIMGGE
ncbi:MAG: Pyridoxal-phosphate dependent enzyme [Candidatus Parcubacteria bacterium]